MKLSDFATLTLFIVRVIAEIASWVFLGFMFWFVVGEHQMLTNNQLFLSLISVLNILNPAKTPSTEN